MVLILDCSSEHSAHVWRNTGFFENNFHICLLITDQITDFTPYVCTPIFELPSNICTIALPAPAICLCKIFNIFTRFMGQTREKKMILKPRTVTQACLHYKSWNKMHSKAQDVHFDHCTVYIPIHLMHTNDFERNEVKHIAFFSLFFKLIVGIKYFRVICEYI